MDHKELKFPVPLESVGTIARYLELGAPLCGPVDGANADFSYHQFNSDVVIKNILIESYGSQDSYALKFEDAKSIPLTEWATFYESPRRAIEPPRRCEINTGPSKLGVLGSKESKFDPFSIL